MVLKNQLGPVDGGLSARNSINTKGSTAFTVGRMMVDAAKPIGSNQPVLGNFNLEALKRHQQSFDSAYRDNAQYSLNQNSYQGATSSRDREQTSVTDRMEAHSQHKRSAVTRETSRHGGTQYRGIGNQSIESSNGQPDPQQVQMIRANFAMKVNNRRMIGSIEDGNLNKPSTADPNVFKSKTRRNRMAMNTLV